MRCVRFSMYIHYCQVKTVYLGLDFIGLKNSGQRLPKGQRLHFRKRNHSMTFSKPLIPSLPLKKMEKWNIFYGKIASKTQIRSMTSDSAGKEEWHIIIKKKVAWHLVALYTTQVVAMTEFQVSKIYLYVSKRIILQKTLWQVENGYWVGCHAKPQSSQLS